MGPGLEFRRHEPLPLAPFEEDALRLLPVNAEGDNLVGLELTGQPSPVNHGIMAIVAEIRYGIVISYHLCAAVGASEQVHLLAIRLAVGGLLLGGLCRA